MGLGEVLRLVPEGVSLEFDRIQESLPKEWIREALTTTGVATIRRRRLPVEDAVWIVIGMSLFHDLPIEGVVDHLRLALPGSAGKSVAKSSIPAARERLGAGPLEWLFSKTGDHWGHPSAGADRWRGLALYGIDGTVLAIPDSEANRSTFGGLNASGVRSAYPAVRVVALMALRSHTLAAARFEGVAHSSEHSLASSIWDEIPDNSLVLMDRGLRSVRTFVGLRQQGTNRHWLTRARKDNKWRVIEALGPDDDLIEVTVHAATRIDNPDVDLPRSYRARAIRYQVGTAEPSTILTSLTDAKQFPRDEIIELYHERWEIEIGFGEIKAQLLEPGDPLRSKTPDGIRQEVWGILLAYNLVRFAIARMADALKVAPVRISFVGALRSIQALLVVGAPMYSPGRTPEYLRGLLNDVKRLVLPKRRRHRRCRREVKGYRERYPHKRPPRLSAAK